MSLKAFHIIFISVSTVLLFAFAWWCFRSDGGGGAGTYGALGGASAAAGAGLVVYGIWFLRKLRQWSDDAAQKKMRSLPGVPGDRGRGPRAAPHAGV